MPEIFARFGFKLRQAPARTQGWKNIVAAIGWFDPYPRYRAFPIAKKAVCILNGWTIILDPELDFPCMPSDEQACAAVSQMLHSKLLGVICDETEATYAYIFCDGVTKRSFWVNEEEVAVNVGDQLPQEPPAGKVDQSFLLELMARLGVDYHALETVSTFYVFELDDSAVWAKAGIVWPR